MRHQEIIPDALHLLASSYMHVLPLEGNHVAAAISYGRDVLCTQPTCFVTAAQMRLMLSAKLLHPLNAATRGPSAMTGVGEHRCQIEDAAACVIVAALRESRA